MAHLPVGPSIVSPCAEVYVYKQKDRISVITNSSEENTRYRIVAGSARENISLFGGKSGQLAQISLLEGFMHHIRDINLCKEWGGGDRAEVVCSV